MNTSIWHHKWYAYCVNRIQSAVLVGAVIVCGACASAVATETGAGPDGAYNVASEAPIDSFQVFCNRWMEKLRDREVNNLAHIQWQEGTEGVQGTYVGYSADYTCTVSADGPPVGKVGYHEIRYQKRGGTIAEAEQSSPLPVETCYTRELFGYIEGKWQY